MGGRDKTRDEPLPTSSVQDGAELLAPLIQGSAAPATDIAPISGVLIGELIAISDNRGTPLVVYPGQVGTAALPARSVIDLHGAHIGRQIALMFECGNSRRPIVMGVLREGVGWPLEERPGRVEVDADGERMIVSAKEQVVLRCGKASITLTKTGKVLIEGAYISSRSTGVNRIKGGSIQLN